MGNCVGDEFRNIRICLLGLDDAGKSTVIRALASENEDMILLENTADVSPTKGFTLQEFKYRKAEIIAYDLGGDERIRSIWTNYYPEVFGVIYVVDGSKQSRLQESGEVLAHVLSHEDLRNKPLLVILNKTDREGCIDEIQLSDRLNLHNLANLYQTEIRVEICQSNAGTGSLMDPALKDGFEWLLERIYDNYDQLEKGVKEALQRLKCCQQLQQMRRQHQLAATASRCSGNSYSVMLLPFICHFITRDYFRCCYYAVICFNSTISDDRSSDTGIAAESAEEPTAEIAVARGAEAHCNESETNYMSKENTPNETGKLPKLSRNAICPYDQSPGTSINRQPEMEYPKLFEVKPLSASQVQQDPGQSNTFHTHKINPSPAVPDIQLATKSAVAQIIPLSVLPRLEKVKESTPGTETI
ncbi:unnamed protein product [Thelazia callipaeda]|uniref:ADP-ribosylation factor-like protein 13B n=1 Tax=Thelazia callipaeda TaxID=103827 RepID=A0A0N5CX81_THECL|nr:unnamed protein product [Thelazia callipaeda]